MLTFSNDKGTNDMQEYSFNDDDYNVSVHCKNYSPRGSNSIMNMSNYNSCDNCRYQRQDSKCGLAEGTLS